MESLGVTLVVSSCAVVRVASRCVAGSFGVSVGVAVCADILYRNFNWASVASIEGELRQDSVLWFQCLPLEWTLGMIDTVVTVLLSWCIAARRLQPDAHSCAMPLHILVS